ncbi:hypothetical protein LTR70_000247 [Exophiala xenobiotica]|nr:hypothetical protein LTR70_000247 [Exophiala xenobiotica]
MASSDDIPMPSPTVPVQPLTSFKLLSFDIYGTLIDWEGGMLQNLAPLLDSAPPDNPYREARTSSSAKAALAAKFHQHESQLNQAHPGKLYPEILTETYLILAKEYFTLDTSSPQIQLDAATFGKSVGTWQAFPDTIGAMTRLSEYYKLVPLSNVDRASFTNTLTGPLADIPFWKSYVASEIGSYKPDLRNFHYLLEHLNADSKAEGGERLEKEEVLHVAQSLFHDHVPAKRMGMSSVWIARKGAGYGVDEYVALHERGEVGYGWRFGSLEEFADEVERDWTTGL